MNRIYLHFPHMEFTTTYYVAVNTLVIEQCAEDILRLKMPRFLTWRGRRWLRGSDEVIFVDTDYTGPETFATDVTGRVFEGSTVTFVALELAYHMGFEEVVLLGSITTSRPGTAQCNDRLGRRGRPFLTALLQRGFRWQLPDLEGSARLSAGARPSSRPEGEWSMRHPGS
jgi:hypothetical protein